MDNDLLETNGLDTNGLDTNGLDTSHINQETQSDIINDIQVDDYHKNKITFVSIDSKDRDDKNTEPNNYNVKLNDRFDNIESIKLEQIQLPYTETPVNEKNNKIRWSYATKEQFLNQGGCNPLTFGMKVDPFGMKVDPPFYQSRWSFS